MSMQEEQQYLNFTNELKDIWMLKTGNQQVIKLETKTDDRVVNASMKGFPQKGESLRGETQSGQLLTPKKQ